MGPCLQPPSWCDASLPSHHPAHSAAFYECMDYYSNTLTKCRKEQVDFEEACPIS
jgi:hypothetical protein